MGLFNASQLCDFAYKAGFRDESLKLAIAIALAESGGDSNAKGANGPTDGCPNGSLDRGLWQINNCYHPDVSDICAYNPQCNADKAYIISNKGTNFHPWSTFLNGAYLQHMDAATMAVENYKPEPVQQQIPDVQATQDVQAIHRRIDDLDEYVREQIASHNNPNPHVLKHYHVRQGDTLWGIAVKFYGDGNKWQQIYNANKGIIGDNPNKLNNNEVLVIP